MSMPSVRRKLSSAVVAFVVLIATVTFVGAGPADAAPPKPPLVKARKVAPPPKPMTSAQRSAQVARDFPTKAPTKATTTQAAAVAAAALCPAAVAAPARAALAPADYMGFGYSLLYNAAGKCVNGQGHVPTDEVVAPGETITATTHVYYTNKVYGGPAGGTTKLPVTVAFKLTDCMNRVTTVNYPGQVQAPYLDDDLSSADYPAWVQAHPNPVSITFTAPSEGCVRTPDDSGWAKWAANTTVETVVTVVGGAAGSGLAGLCVNGVASEAVIGGGGVQSAQAEPVNTVTGAYTESARDLENEGDGVPLAVTRSYSSDDTVTSPLGPGWMMPWFASATTTDSGATVTVRTETGARQKYLRDYTGTHLAAAGSRDTLVSVSAGGWTLTSLDQHKLTFDSGGKLTAITDRTGRTTTLTYSGTILASVKDSAGAVATLTQASGRVTAVVLGDGRRVDYAYTSGRLTSAKASDTAATTYAYDSGGRLASRTNGLGKPEVRNTYDSSGRVSQQLDALGNRTGFVYSTGRTDVTDPRGGIWTDMHANNVVQASYDPLGAKTGIAWNDQLNPTTLTQPDGTQLVSAFDASGRVVKAARPVTETGTPTMFTYDSAGNVATYAQPSGGGTTTFSYTTAKQLSSVKNPAGDVTSYTYGTGGVLASATTPAGRRTTFSYDSAGRRTQVITVGGGRTTMAYDAGGHVTEQRVYRDPADLAAGKTVTASSTFSTAYPATAATDGNPTTRWSSTTTDPSWIRLDLGTAQPVDRVRLNWEAAYATAYQIQTSTDGSTWTDAYSTTTGKGGEEVISFTSVSARYVRMYGTKRAPAGGYSLWDFNIYNTATRDFDATRRRYDSVGRVIEERQRGPAANGYRDYTYSTSRYDSAGRLAETRTARQIPADLALKQTVTASSSYSGFPAANAVDGNPATRWSSEFSDPQWLQIDLGSAKTVDRVRLEWEAAYATAYQIQTSTDGTTWATAWSTTTGRGGEEIVTFTPVTARYVRMSGTKRASTAGYSLWDFEVTSAASVAWDSTTYGYDDAGRLTSTTDPAGNTTSSAYDGVGNLASSTDAEGNKTSYTYDAANRIATKVSPRGNTPGADPAAFTTSYTYDKNSNLDTETDPTGAVTNYDYDVLGQLVAVTDPLGHKIGYGYDKNGNRTSITDAKTQTTTFTYDAANRLKSSTDPLGHTTAYSYDTDGNLTSVTSPTGAKTAYLYNLDGQRAGVVEPRGNVSGAKVSDYTTYTSYDAAGRPTVVTDPLGGQTHTGYDPAGQQVSAIDAAGLATTYAYNALSQLTSVTAPGGSTTDYTYDTAGNPVQWTDANGHITAYGYDKNHRQTSVTDPLNHKVSYGYDPDGNRTTVVNARGTTATSSYDARDLRSGVDYADSTPDVTYLYDKAGRVTSITDGAGTRTLGYDDNDMLTSTTGFAYMYDKAGNVATRTLPDGRTTSYGYDNDDRPTSQTTDGATTTFGYDAAAHLTSTVLPAGTHTTETRTYDRAGRLTGVNGLTVTRDAAGRPAKVVSAVAGQNRLYTYDQAGRLGSECLAPTADQDCQGGTLTTYGYDKVGNRLTQAVRDGTTTASTYDDADRLLTAGATSYVYDTDGNQTTAGADTFSYDAEGRQTSATSGGVTYTYGYDDTGNRVTARRDGTLVRTSTWDVNNPLPQLATDSGTVTASYLPNPEGQPLVQRTSAGGYYQIHDWLGSVTDVVDATGTPQRRTTYDAYGVAGTTALTANAPPATFGFTGALNDADLAGQVRFPARTYTPATGAFTSRDPQQYPLTKGYTSTYAYAEDVPTVYTDPSGRCAMICTAIAGGIIGGLVGGGVYAWKHRNDEDFSWTGLAKASGEGALIGAGAGLLMPAAGAGVAGYFGLEGGAATATSMAVNAGFGAGYTYGVNTALCQPTTPTDLFIGAIGGALTGAGVVAGSAGRGAPVAGGVARDAESLLWTTWQQYPKVSVNGQEYARIGSRLYSKHAVERMQPSGMRYSPRPGPDEGGSTGGMPQIRQAGSTYDYGRGVSPTWVEYVIKNSIGTIQNNRNISHTLGSLQVIVSQEGRVVTVITH